MDILIKKKNGLILPKKAYQSAAYDLTSISEPRIQGNFIENTYGMGRLYDTLTYLEYDTGIQLELKNKSKKQYFTAIFPRSSITSKNLSLKNSVGIIDPDYRGNIFVRFRYDPDPQDYIIVPETGINKIYVRINPETIYHAGDKIAQMIIYELLPSNIKEVDNLSETIRAEKGFGSSGK